MQTSNFSVTEEEIIAAHVHQLLMQFKVHSFFSERIGVEIAFQNGNVQAANLNFYKTRPQALGNINCIVPPLSDEDKHHIKNHTFDILTTLHMLAPVDLFGNIEIVFDFDPARKMRIKNVAVNLHSFFKLQAQSA